MPIIKSAMKRVRQNLKRQEALRPVKTKMKTLMRSAISLSKEGKKAEAEKLLPSVFKAIDLASKKGIIHWKNAARKKSLVSRTLAAKA